jgi:hypothetical protein
MKPLLKLSAMIVAFFLLTACLDFGGDDDKKNADACEGGDQSACDTLNADLEIATAACDDGDLTQCARKALLDALIDSIPQNLVIASSTSITNSGNDSEFTNKQNTVESFLNDTLTSNDFASCLGALPSQPQVEPPLCYGPAVDYENHPDSSGGTEDGQLPTGDLGLWVENEPSTGEACAAAKLNELVAKAAYNVDLAIGSMTMMICTSALLGKELPTDSNATLDLTHALGNLPNGNITVEKAIIKKANLTNGDGYQTELEATINSQPIKLSVIHDAQNNKGLMKIETMESSHNGGNDTRGTSVVYELPNTSVKYKMISSRAQPQGASDPVVSYANDGQISLQAGEDIHIMQAEINDADGYGSLAYAWKAGGNDDHYRALNVVTEATGNGTGRAYYGYVPSPTAGSETINLDLNHSSAGMICNWAGPGNDHSTNNKVQYQALAINNGEWTATSSNIVYAPTVSCDMSVNTGTFTPAFGGPDNSSHTPSTHEQTVIDNGTLDSNAGAVSNDLLDQSSLNFTLPSAPSAPQ